MIDVASMILDPVTGEQRQIRAGEQLVDGDGNPLSIEVGHTPVNYTPVGADPTDMNAHFAGIDAKLFNIAVEYSPASYTPVGDPTDIDSHLEGIDDVLSVLDLPETVIFTEASTVPGGVPTVGRGKLWVRDDDANVLVFTNDAGVDTVLGGGGGVIGGGWRFSAETADADPGSGDFRLDNAAQGSAGQIFISDIAANGLNASGILLALSSGDKIYLQESADPLRFHEANVTGNPTDAGTYVKIPITMLDSGADLRNNRNAFVVVVGTGGAGAGGLPALDTTIIVQDDGDITKQMRFEASGIPTSTTIVLTLPAASKTLDGVGDSRPPSAHTHTLVDITDSGALAALSTITLAEVTDSGALAALNTITLAEVTDSGVLAALNTITLTEVTDSGALAPLDNITLALVTDSGALAPLDTVSATEIDTGAVTLVKVQEIDTDRFLGRTSLATGVVEQLTPTQATAMLDVFTSALQGLVPASGGTATDYLGGAGSWGAVDHGGLAGNADDDHAQYALLAGRTGGQTLAGSATSTEGLTLRANLAALDGSVSVTTTTASVSTITGALTVAGGVGIVGDVFMGSDLDVAGKLTVAGLIDPTGMQFDVQTSNPGNANTIWIRQADGALMHGNAVVEGGGGGGGGAITAGTNEGQLTYWDEGQQLWLPALGLDWDDTTQIFRIGSGIGSSASPEPNASFTVDAITGDVNVGGSLSIDGKLTVAGLIDPTGMVFDEQVTVPGGAPGVAKGTLWVRNDTPNVLIFTDDIGADVQLGAPIADHGLLTGLVDDDHSQYTLLAGRTGGQTLSGSGTATEGLTLRANAAALDGTIQILTTTASTSTSSGGLVVDGGIGTGGSLFVGGTANVGDGAVGAPTLAFTDAATTGLFRDTATGAVRLAIGGSLAVSFGGSFSVIDFANYTQLELLRIADANGTKAIELGTAGVPLRQLFDASSSLCIDWASRALVDSSGTHTVQWGAGWLTDSSQAVSVDFGGRSLQLSGGTTVVDWANQYLYDSSGVTAVNWGSRYLLDFSGSPAVEWASSDGVYIPSGSSGYLAMDTISAPGAPSFASGGRIYFDSITGALMVHFAAGSAVQIAAYA